MNRYEIKPTRDSNGNFYLNRTIQGFYHSDYLGGGNWRVQGTIENMIWTLKNDVSPFPMRLPQAIDQLFQILVLDLPKIIEITGFSSLTVCVVPRAKKDSYYTEDQLFFRKTVSRAVNSLNPRFRNGAQYIIRHTDTRTTHLDRNGEGGSGHLPYSGITKETCTISPEIVGRDILLIDDLYTRSINIDEDAIQALLDKRANSVIFYTIGSTIARNIDLPNLTQQVGMPVSPLVNIDDSEPDDDLPF